MLSLTFDATRAQGGLILTIARLAPPADIGGFVFTMGVGEVYVTLFAHIIKSSSGILERELTGCMSVYTGALPLSDGPGYIYVGFASSTHARDRHGARQRRGLGTIVEVMGRQCFDS